MPALTRLETDLAPPATAVLVRGAQTAGRLAMIATTEHPGSEPPCHCHHWEDEVLYVLHGTVALYCDGTWTRHTAGSTAVVPRGTEHTFAVLTPAAQLLTSFAPAGLEGWYGEGDAASPWQRPLEQIIVGAARFGCEITGPHPGQPR